MNARLEELRLEALNLHKDLIGALGEVDRAATDESAAAQQRVDHPTPATLDQAIERLSIEARALAMRGRNDVAFSALLAVFARLVDFQERCVTFMGELLAAETAARDTTA